MGCSDFPTVVFTETNLGTRLAVPASPEITADDFKREVEKAHLNCFPEFGNIRVEAVMVKKRSHLYHLSRTLPLKFVFLGSNRTWFLQARVILPNVPTHVKSSKHDEAKVHNCNSAANEITGSVELGSSMSSFLEKRPNRERKEVKVQRFPCLKISTASCFIRKRKRKNPKKKRPKTEKEMPCRFTTEAEVDWSKESSSKAEAAASVSGIIKKYFSDYDEVASSPRFPFTPMQCANSKKPSSEASRGKHKNPKVGARLLHASNSLRLAPGNRKAVLSLCHYNYGESPSHKFKQQYGT